MRVLGLYLVIALIAARACGEDLNCLAPAAREAAKLYPQLQAEAFTALDSRRATFEQLQTREQIRAYQRRLREFFVEQLGGFPERTPLNARTVGTIDADGYKIEKVIFESQPNHHVTANLYLPNVDVPYPGVVVSSGHSRTAKTADYNQRFGIMMARQGMAALCFDPIGQGERSQILNDSGQPMFSSTTTEHFLVGVGSILVGRNTARYRIWDAMRAIDYLSQRPEVDPGKIGMTGCSGGGTLTSYVMALDERVYCAAPACYLTTFRRLIETIGPQDAEQNIFGQLAGGLDQPDYVLLRGPKPTLISSTTGDFFDIAGSWDNYRQAKRVYSLLGYPERVDLVEVPGNHGVQPQNLATIAHWMNRWLRGVDAPVQATVLETRPADELLCIESGQVLHLPGERSVFDLNADYEQELHQERTAEWKQNELSEQRQRVAAKLGVTADHETKSTLWEEVGRVPRDGYHIDKLLLQAQDGPPLPTLVFHPAIPQDESYLYLHDSGKTGDAEPGGPIEQLVQDGYVVVSIDLRGQGELRTDKVDPLLTGWKTFFLSYLLGKSIQALRVEDAVAGGDFVAFYQKSRDKPRNVHLIGVGQAGITALHAAAIQPQLFTSVTLRGTPKSWADTVRSSVPAGQLDSAVHGALEVYDLPDLVRLAGADKVTLED